jgi:hypothetical protein
VFFTGLTPETRAPFVRAFTDAVQRAWSGQFGQYNVTTRVVDYAATLGPNGPMDFRSSPGDGVNTVEFVRMPPGFRSYVTSSQHAIINVNGLDRGNVYAHESGHLLGLGDRYVNALGGSVAHPGWANNVMGILGGAIEQRNIDEALSSSVNTVTTVPPLPTRREAPDDPAIQPFSTEFESLFEGFESGIQTPSTTTDERWDNVFRPE